MIDVDETSAIHHSLVRPNLIMGCERELYLITIMTSAMLVGPSGIFLGNWGTAIFGIFLWVVGTIGLSVMAKKDPQLSKIYRRSIRYRKRYVAKSYVDQEPSQYLRW